MPTPTDPDRGRAADVTAEGLVGPLEYEALQEVWADGPATVREVLGRINERRDGDDELAYTTVMTVLSRLHDKGLLDREKVGRGYAYAAAYSEAELVTHLGEQEVTELVDRFGEVALAQFAAALEDADAELLRRAAALAGIDATQPGPEGSASDG